MCKECSEEDVNKLYREEVLFSWPNFPFFETSVFKMELGSGVEGVVVRALNTATKGVFAVKRVKKASGVCLTSKFKKIANKVFFSFSHDVLCSGIYVGNDAGIGFEPSGSPRQSATCEHCPSL